MQPRTTPDSKDCTWICTGNATQKGCLQYVQDEAGIAKRCPGCKAPKPPQENEENQEMKQLSYSEMLKKSSKVFGVRLQNIDQEGNLPLPPEEQEAAATIKELESEIVKLEGIV